MAYASVPASKKAFAADVGFTPQRDDGFRCVADKILLVALMNPGEKYRQTRHNAGAMALDALYPQVSYSDSKALQAETGTLETPEGTMIFLKPQTFMNLSGQSVARALKKYSLAPARMIVFHDEVELPVREVRHKFGGGHKGHNGLRSIIATTGSGDFHRIRIGVGRPADDSAGIADYLLSFQPEAQRATAGDLEPAVATALRLVQGG